ncbi:hypothetical protein AXF42_Ash006203 [Apostasia shenzhenica]|uniref:Uncharacterized protein n=1 Tax=Apostasia shenzhenica TaxID=1088818 RepID=A0A2I0B0J5_9ASPA|nr:hypothetical protein AXF42_Ash006203 [Apostasia shenzhenica]
MKSIPGIPNEAEERSQELRTPADLLSSARVEKLVDAFPSVRSARRKDKFLIDPASL